MKKAVFIAPFPPANVRQSIRAEDWTALLEGWLAVTNAYLKLSDEQFRKLTDDDDSLLQFLLSFFDGADHTTPSTGQVTGFQELRRNAFLLAHRSLGRDRSPPLLLNGGFLLSLCRTFPRSEAVRKLMEVVWAKHSPVIEKTLQELKNDLTSKLESSNPDAAVQSLKDLSRFLFQSPDAGRFFMTGSSFLDSLASAYGHGSKQLQPPVLTVTYTGLLSLVVGPKANYPLLADHLYSLKSGGDESSGRFLADLVTNTPLLEKIREHTSTDQGLRARNVAASLDSLKRPGMARRKRITARKLDKGKTRAIEDEFDRSANENAHVHRMSLVTQVQDLFPDLGSAFVIKLLQEYGDDVEQVTAHLLDNSLPPHLTNTDKSEQLPPTVVSDAKNIDPSNAIHERRNVFDNDAFDRLTVSASQLHIGRREREDDETPAPARAAILSALAAFDSDDDERDDTYDAEDVGGTVDSAVSGQAMDDADLRDGNEAALFRAYSASPQTFGRDAETRRGKAREVLRGETGMTDEAIEGWAIMVSRDPRRLRKLEARHSTFTGQQLELPSSKYRGGATSGEEDSDAPDGGAHAARGRGGRGGRGRPRGRGRGGGGNARSEGGSTEDKNTQASRQRKEANKGSRANHNRRDQRARKMARGGLPG